MRIPRILVVKWMVLVVALLSGFSARAFALEPARAGQESFLVRAVFAENELWALSDAGKLIRIGVDSNTPLNVQLPEPALDLCLLGGRPAVITCDGSACEKWTLRRWGNGNWVTEAAVQAEHDRTLALSCDTGKPVLLTNRRLIDLSPSQPGSVTLSEELRFGVVSSVHLTQDWVFVGINAGEWGGGLTRIDRRTGKVGVIEANATGGLCAGPLNTKCDPVNGIADEPGRPDCVVVAVGLVHFSPQGRLVEVCGERVGRLYFKPYGPEGDRKHSGSDEPFSTVAFFGLTRDGDSLWAVGIDGIYRVEQGKVAEVVPLPEFKEVGAFRVSFALPRLVLLLTSANQRHSISGSVPMVVPR